MKKRTNLLSIIIPSYNQEKTITRDIKRIVKTLKTLTYKYELIIVVDGNLSKTKVLVNNLKYKNVKCIGYEINKGKGYAIRYGIAHSKGPLVVFLDAGMDLHPKSIFLILDTMDLYKADIVIGSKMHPLSDVSYPLQRRIMSWGYRLVVKSLFGLNIQDTQVGLKLFKRKVLLSVLPKLLVKRYAFDIELLALARHLGYKRIVEAPVKLKFNKWSSITSGNFWKIIILMLWDTAAVFYRLKIVHYYDKNNKKTVYDPELNFKINVG